MILPNTVALGSGKKWLVAVAWERTQTAGGLRLWSGGPLRELTSRSQSSFMRNGDPQKGALSHWRRALGCLWEAGWGPAGCLSKERRRPGQREKPVYYWGYKQMAFLKESFRED